jgi:hypothetical protein
VQTHPIQIFIDAARTNSPALKSLFATSVFDLKERGAAAVWGQNFLFAIETEQTTTVR